MVHPHEDTDTVGPTQVLSLLDEHGGGEFEFKGELPSHEKLYWDRSIRRYLQEFADSLTATGAVEHQEQFRSLLLDPSHYCVTVRDFNDFNAMSLRAPNGCRLVILNSVLLYYVYEFARILAGQLSFTDEDEDEIPPLEVTCSRLRFLLSVSSSFLRFPESRRPRITDQQTKAAVTLALVAERFILAHEVAHSLLGHDQEASSQLLELQGVRIDLNNRSWTQEYQADSAAYVLVMSSLVHAHVPSYQVYAGIEVFLQAFSLLDEFSNAPVSESHPSPRDRLAQVRSMVKFGSPETVTTTHLAIAINQMIQHYRPHLLPA